MISYSNMSQIFKYVVPLALLTDLLDKICNPGEHYIIDNNAYKRMKFHGYHTLLIETLAPYYHLSKRYYIERAMTYPSFMTIVRQICRIWDIEIRTNIDSAGGISYVVTNPTESV